MPFVLTIATLFLLRGYIAARAQLVTFILFVLTIYFIESFLKTGQKRYAVGLIIIPIIICNVHLAVFPFYFILYLPYIGEYIISKLCLYPENSCKRRIVKLQKKIGKSSENQKLKNKLEVLQNKYNSLIEAGKKTKKPYKIIVNSNKFVPALILIMIMCVFTGLLTPLKDTPYTYLIKTMQGNTTKNISEHLPLVLIEHKEFMILLLSYIAILTFTDTKIRLSDLFLIGGLTLLAFMTRRQESMVILLGTFVINRLICDFINKYDKTGFQQAERAATKPVGVIITMTLVVLTSMLIYKQKMNSPYVVESNYPVQASEWILDNIDLSTARLYNEYNYGSYLLFKGIPVFIDSRADLYAPEFNGKNDIFTDFLDISGLNIMDVQHKLNEYNFTHLLFKKNSRLGIYIKLKPDQYKEIYKDDYFIIYEKI